ncbi:MAG: biotin synthase [Holophagaceae bacterium]|nr:biotin synthase [Holophagaceae bacterium]
MKQCPTPQAIRAIHDQPFPELVRQAMASHRQHWNPLEVQLCVLDALKTGDCSEDCAYCAQSAHHTTTLKADPLKDRDKVLEGARRALESGATRYCMATSGRGIQEGPDFDRVLEIVQSVSDLGLEPCVSLGLIHEGQARRLKAAGCAIYNHNLDSSRLVYQRIVSTHTFDERLETIRAVREAGLQVCCGGILGLGESLEDRIHFLHELASLDPIPDAIPFNILVPIPGTPLEGMPPLPPLEAIRVIATARILFPTSRIRLAAGRTSLSPEAQALAFLCGANSIFSGEKLLTTPGSEADSDQVLLRNLGMHPEGGKS